MHYARHAPRPGLILIVVRRRQDSPADSPRETGRAHKPPDRGPFAGRSPASLQRFPGYPIVFSRSPMLVRVAGSSIVAGIEYSTPSAIFFIVPRRIFPDRVFGSP